MNKPLKMLIIDDNKELVSALFDFFSNKKFDVAYALDGLEGLKLLEAEKQGFDIVITDIVMPHISGIGIISIIKNKYPDIPVIATTGWGEHPEALAAEFQADFVLEKPFELVEVHKLIMDLLSQKNK